MYPSGSNINSSRYSSRIISSGSIFVSSRTRFNINKGNWQELSKDVLLCILLQLKLKDLLATAQTCRHWNSVASSDYLWMKYFQINFHQDPSIPLSPRARVGWRSEYKRLWHHAPVMQCEVLRDHRNCVLHVAFANAGDMFATCSIDAQVMVWSVDYPCRVLYQANLQRKFNWKFASFSQFNSTDTMLMVSGAYFGTGPFLTAGEVVIFDLENDFRLLSRTKNRPYDLFGAWITDDHLVTGELSWLQNMHSTSTLIMIRATQETSSELVPIFAPLFRLFNSNSACARAVMVATCSGAVVEKKVMSLTRCMDEPVLPNTISYSTGYYDQQEQQQLEQQQTQSIPECAQDRPLTPPRSLDNKEERLIIFTTGSNNYTPHQIGIIRHQPVMPERVYAEHDIQELLRRRDRRRQRIRDNPGVDRAEYEAVKQLCRPLDYTIDVGGSVVGMALSPDHRYLYINSHPWASSSPALSQVTAPAIATHVDTHVVDLLTMEQVGSLLYRSVASVPSDESYYIFPSVSHHYVASGGARNGRLWDRHYGLCLAEMSHSDSVSSVSLNPQDPEMMVTVSDDKTIKVWRSRRIATRCRIVRAVESKLMQSALES